MRYRENMGFVARLWRCMQPTGERGVGGVWGNSLPKGDIIPLTKIISLTTNCLKYFFTKEIDSLNDCLVRALART